MQAVPEQAHARTGLVMPGDGDFSDFEAQLARDGEDLNVKTPTFQPLEREDCIGCFSREAFKTALRVLQTRKDEQAHEDVINAPDEMAVDGLPNALGTRRFARGDTDWGEG